MQTSIGILETKGFAAAITAADKILEDNSVNLIKVEKAGDGIISLFFKGETEKLKTAFDKGIHAARSVGEIIALHIIAKPNVQLERFLFGAESETELIVAAKEKIQEKDIPIGGEKDVKKSKVQKRITEINELTDTTQKFKLSKVSGTTSTIQRLRREALSSEKFSKERQKGAKGQEEKEKTAINMSVIENLSVHELRKLARNINGFPIQGREISRANRKELIIYFKELA